MADGEQSGIVNNPVSSIPSAWLPAQVVSTQCHGTVRTAAPNIFYTAVQGSQQLATIAGSGVNTSAVSVPTQPIQQLLTGSPVASLGGLTIVPNHVMNIYIANPDGSLVMPAGVAGQRFGVRNAAAVIRPRSTPQQLKASPTQLHLRIPGSVMLNTSQDLTQQLQQCHSAQTSIQARSPVVMHVTPRNIAVPGSAGGGTPLQSQRVSGQKVTPQTMLPSTPIRTPSFSMNADSAKLNASVLSLRNVAPVATKSSIDGSPQVHFVVASVASSAVGMQEIRPGRGSQAPRFVQNSQASFMQPSLAANRSSCSQINRYVISQSIGVSTQSGPSQLVTGVQCQQYQRAQSRGLSTEVSPSAQFRMPPARPGTTAYRISMPSQKPPGTSVTSTTFLPVPLMSASTSVSVASVPRGHCSQPFSSVVHQSPTQLRGRVQGTLASEAGMLLQSAAVNISPSQNRFAGNVQRGNSVRPGVMPRFGMSANSIDYAVRGNNRQRGTVRRITRKPAPQNTVLSPGGVQLNISPPELFRHLRLASQNGNYVIMNTTEDGGSSRLPSHGISVSHSEGGCQVATTVQTSVFQPSTSSISSCNSESSCQLGKRYCLFFLHDSVAKKVFCGGKHFQLKKPTLTDDISIENQAAAVPADTTRTHVMPAAGGDVPSSVENSVQVVTELTAPGQFYTCPSCRIVSMGTSCVQCCQSNQAVPSSPSLPQTTAGRGLIGAAPRTMFISSAKNASPRTVVTFKANTANASPAANIRAYLQKTGRKKSVARVAKRTEPEVVHILSSDDEEEKSASSCASSTDTSSLPASSGIQQQSFQPHILSVYSQANEAAAKQLQASEAVRQQMTDNISMLPAQPPDLLMIRARYVRIGSLVLSRVQECVFFAQALRITFTPEGSTGLTNLPLMVSEMRTMLIHYGPSGPVVFLLMTPECGKKLRNILSLSDPSGAYYDPESADDSTKFVVIIPQQSAVTQEDMTHMIARMQNCCPQESRFQYDALPPDVTKTLLCSIMRSNATQPSAVASSSSGSSASPVALPTQVAPAFSQSAPQRLVLPASMVATCFLTPSSQLRFVLAPKLELLKAVNASQGDGDEDEEMADRSRSPSPPHPIFTGPVVRLFIYPPPPATGGITVTNEDFYCLNEGEFLNDVIIDFYLKYLTLEMLSTVDRDRTHVFSSFFYRRLTQKESRGFADDNKANLTLQQRRHLRVKTWTRHVDLFAKDFIFVPINESAHWYLAVICFPGLLETVRSETAVSAASNTPSDEAGSETTDKQQSTDKPATAVQVTVKQPCILIFDSLMSQHYGVIRTLREYLQEEWNVRKVARGDGPRDFTKDSCRGVTVRCPQQTNFSDCGVYVLQYAESFFMNPVSSFSFPFMSLLDWFPEEVVLKKRDALQQLVLSLKQRLNPDLDYDPRAGTVPAHKAVETTDSGEQSAQTAIVADADTAAENGGVDTRASDSVLTCSDSVLAVDSDVSYLADSEADTVVEPLAVIKDACVTSENSACLDNGEISTTIGGEHSELLEAPSLPYGETDSGTYSMDTVQPLAVVSMDPEMGNTESIAASAVMDQLSDNVNVEPLAVVPMDHLTQDSAYMDTEQLAAGMEHLTELTDGSLEMLPLAMVPLEPMPDGVVYMDYESQSTDPNSDMGTNIEVYEEECEEEDLTSAPTYSSFTPSSENSVVDSMDDIPEMVIDVRKNFKSRSKFNSRKPKAAISKVHTNKLAADTYSLANFTAKRPSGTFVQQVPSVVHNQNVPVPTIPSKVAKRKAVADLSSVMDMSDFVNDCTAVEPSSSCSEHSELNNSQHRTAAAGVESYDAGEAT